MMTAIVFVRVRPDRIPEVAEQIASLETVREVYSVTGNIDLIAMVKVSSFDQISDVVSTQMSKIDGVESTETHLAFRTLSRHDLESTFTLGT